MNHHEPTEIKEKIRSFLERVRLMQGLELEEYDRLLGLSSGDYDSFLNGRKELSAFEYVKILDKFNVDTSNLLRDNIDFRALQLHQQGRWEYLSEKYTKAARSKKRTVVNILNYVTDYYVTGPFLRKAALDYFQANEKGLVRLDEEVNINFVTELIQFFKSKLRADDDLFYAMGTYSYTTNQGTELQKRLSSCRSVRELYERFFTMEIGLIEKNCDYGVQSLGDGRCVVWSNSNKEVCEGLNVKQLGSESVCAFRAGVIASAPLYLGMPAAKVVHSKCVHKGGSRCEFHVSYSTIQSPRPHFSGNLLHIM